MKKLIILCSIVLFTGCSPNDKENQLIESSLTTEIANTQDSLDRITCVQIQIGLGGTIGITVFYCCPVEMCFPVGAMTCLGCGILTDDPRKTIGAGINEQHPFRIHVSQLTEENTLSSDSITVTSSSTIELDGQQLSVELGTYAINPNGYINLRLIN